MPSSFTTRPELAGTFGAVASSHWLASQAGMTILDAGGNAFDAAACAGLVLEVVEPHQSGLGGEAPMVLYSSRDDQVFVVDGQGPAPRAATSEAFRDLGLDLVPGTGLLAACVPGAFGAWITLLQRFGTMSLQEVISPAIGYARNGFPALPSLSAALADAVPYFKQAWPTSLEVWPSVPPPGGRISNPILAGTLERLAAGAGPAAPNRESQLEAARLAFYEGWVAEAITSFVATPQADGAGEHAGFLAGGDLASWTASLEAPAHFGYRDFEVFKPGPWSQGPVFLQQLALLQGFDLKSLEHSSAELVHVMAECAKLAYADREAFYGDQRYVDVPIDELLSSPYNDKRRLLVDEKASLEARPGSPAGALPRLPAHLGQPGLAHAGTKVEALGERDTCHVDVADRFGNFVSATPSGGWLQSSPAVPGLGFCLGTRAQMFWLEDGLASSLHGGARPRTTLSPSLAFRDGKPYMAFGTPGGDCQDQWPLRAFIYHADFGLPLQAAVDTPAWHIEHLPSSFYPRHARPGDLFVEDSLPPGTLDELASRGHRLVRSPEWTHGRVTAVARTPDGLFRAAADPRHAQAYAAVR